MHDPKDFSLPAQQNSIRHPSPLPESAKRKLYAQIQAPFEGSSGGFVEGDFKPAAVEKELVLVRSAANAFRFTDVE